MERLPESGLTSCQSRFHNDSSLDSITDCLMSTLDQVAPVELEWLRFGCMRGIERMSYPMRLN